MFSTSKATPERRGSKNRVAAFFNHLLAAFGFNIRQNSRREHVEFYDAMTDAELSKRGIERKNIVHHVFRDLYYT